MPKYSRIGEKNFPTQFRKIMCIRILTTVVMVLISVSVKAQDHTQEVSEQWWHVLASAPEMDFYSLEPSLETKAIDKTSFYYPHQVLGRVTVRQGSDLAKLLVDACRKAVGKGERQSRCFEPDYALLGCSPKTGPEVMRVFKAHEGKETRHDEEWQETA